MSYFPTPFGHLADWRVDCRDPRPSARAKVGRLDRKKARR
jgi:hypothetical protein